MTVDTLIHLRTLSKMKTAAIDFLTWNMHPPTRLAWQVALRAGVEFCYSSIAHNPRFRTKRALAVH
jgi:hypothetical protein